MKSSTNRVESIAKMRDRLFMNYVSIELGIVPIENVDDDIRRALRTVEKAEARKMKRKFRKLWRKCAKAMTGKMTHMGSTKKRLGWNVGNEKPNWVPTRAQKHARKLAVYHMIIERYVAPLIDTSEQARSVSKE